MLSRPGSVGGRTDEARLRSSCQTQIVPDAPFLFSLASLGIGTVAIMRGREPEQGSLLPRWVYPWAAGFFYALSALVWFRTFMS